MFKIQLLFLSMLLMITAGQAQGLHQIAVYADKKPLKNHPIEINQAGVPLLKYTDSSGRLAFTPINTNYYIKLEVFGHMVCYYSKDGHNKKRLVKIYTDSSGYQIVENGLKQSYTHYSKAFSRAAAEMKEFDESITTPTMGDKIPPFFPGGLPSGTVRTSGTPTLYRDETIYDGTVKSKPTPAHLYKGRKIKDDIYAPSETKAGKLTAGEVNDFSKWNLWKDLTDKELNQYMNRWGIKPANRYTVQVINKNKKPIVNAHVSLTTISGKVVWESKTDNTGKAELWQDIYSKQVAKKDKLTLKISYQGMVKTLHNISSFHEGINTVKMKVACDMPSNIDIAFIVDATGSMGDEIEYLKTELNDVIHKVKTQLPNNPLRLGTVFYRDMGDEYVTRCSPLDHNTDATIQFIKKQRAGGGGDVPEGVDTALSTAINCLNWDSNAITRIAFLILDAPPHENQASVSRVKKMIQKASAMGIRLIPITASGLDKNTEYLMRCMALATNGTYVFLTDDSGIGNSHIKPSTDHYRVELLNNLILRLITQYAYSKGCEPVSEIPDSTIKDTAIVVNPIWIDKEDSAITDSTNQTQQNNEQQPTFKSWKVYPNPTNGPINIEIEGALGELYLTDNSGKILQRISINNQQYIQLNIEQYPAGIYYIKYIMTKGSFDAKIILVGNK